MAFKRRAGGAWTDPTAIKRRAAGAWVVVGFVRRRVGGVWVDALSTVLTAVLSPTSINTSGPNGTRTEGMTCVPSGGSGTKTYSWTWVSGGTGMTLLNPTSASVLIETTGNDTTRTGTIQCQVTDASGSTIVQGTVWCAHGTLE